MRRILHLSGLLVLALPAWCGEYAVLSNGFRLRVDRHEALDGKLRLYSGQGMMEMAAASVAGFEPEESVPVPPADVAPPSTPPPAVAEMVSSPGDLAAEAARTFALPAAFVASVMKAESAFRQNALSPKGAIGLMQLMPQTARELGVNPLIARENALGGARYLHELLAKYESHPDQVLLALAAYNAGPAAVDRYHGVPPFRETHDYILRVLKNWKLQDPSR